MVTLPTNPPTNHKIVTPQTPRSWTGHWPSLDQKTEQPKRFWKAQKTIHMWDHQLEVRQTTSSQKTTPQCMRSHQHIYSVLTLQSFPLMEELQQHIKII